MDPGAVYLAGSTWSVSSYERLASVAMVRKAEATVQEQRGSPKLCSAWAGIARYPKFLRLISPEPSGPSAGGQRHDGAARGPHAPASALPRFLRDSRKPCGGATKRRRDASAPLTAGGFLLQCCRTRVRRWQNGRSAHMRDPHGPRLPKLKRRGHWEEP
jgi:hypothetical protein